MHAHLILGHAIEAFVSDPARSVELCSSGQAYLQVGGDSEHAAGRAHLGGRLEIVEGNAERVRQPSLNGIG
jgi:hypothetical protein